MVGRAIVIRDSELGFRISFEFRISALGFGSSPARIPFSSRATPLSSGETESGAEG